MSIVNVYQMANKHKYNIEWILLHHTHNPFTRTPDINEWETVVIRFICFFDLLNNAESVLLYLMNLTY